jgi:hypothetical protein
VLVPGGPQDDICSYQLPQQIQLRWDAAAAQINRGGDSLMRTREWSLMGDLDMMMHIRLKAHEDEQAEQIGQVLQQNLCSRDDSKKLNRKSWDANNIKKT